MSADFCDGYIRASLGLAPLGAGLVTLGGFLGILGALFAGSTLLLWAFVPEARGHGGSPAAVEVSPPLGDSGVAPPTDALSVDDHPRKADDAALAVVDGGAPSESTSRPRRGSSSGSTRARRSAGLAAATSDRTAGVRRRTPTPKGGRRSKGGFDAATPLQLQGVAGALSPTGRPTAQAAAAAADKADGGGRPLRADSCPDDLEADAAPLLATGSGSIAEDDAGGGRRRTAAPASGAKQNAPQAPLTSSTSGGSSSDSPPPEALGSDDDGSSGGGGLSSAWAALLSSYASLVQLLRLPAMLRAAAYFLVAKVAFPAVDRSASIVMQARQSMDEGEGVRRPPRRTLRRLSRPLISLRRTEPRPDPRGPHEPQRALDALPPRRAGASWRAAGERRQSQDEAAPSPPLTPSGRRVAPHCRPAAARHIHGRLPVAPRLRARLPVRAVRRRYGPPGRPRRHRSARLGDDGAAAGRHQRDGARPDGHVPRAGKGRGGVRSGACRQEGHSLPPPLLSSPPLVRCPSTHRWPTLPWAART